MQIQSQLVALEDAYPRRPRAKYAGKLIQMDASSFVWFGEKKTTLHVAINDSTGVLSVPGSTKKKHSMDITMYFPRSFIPMVSLTSSLQTEELYSPLKRKIPPLSRRILLLSSLIPATSLA